MTRSVCAVVVAEFRYDAESREWIAFSTTEWYEDPPTPMWLVGRHSGCGRRIGAVDDDDVAG
jgi:hypothetical protein